MQSQWLCELLVFGARLGDHGSGLLGIMAHDLQHVMNVRQQVGSSGRAHALGYHRPEQRKFRAIAIRTADEDGA